MRIGISNVGWNREEDDAIVAMLPQLGVEALEVAPSRLWDEPFDARALEAYRDRVGLPVVSLQSLFYGHPELQLFGESRPQLVDRLRSLCDVAALLGARTLVFGSPGNRQRGPIDPEAALESAAETFAEVGGYAAGLGCAVCVEPLPDCDFVATVAEARELERLVSSPGFGVHLDSAVLAATGESVDAAPRHFHATETGFGVLGAAGVDHRRFARQLRAAGYRGVVSIESFAVQGSNAERVRASVAYAREAYA